MATEATNEETTNKSESNDDGETNETDLITVGRLVEVASRTWPGINKPGGVARVVEVHFDACNETNDEGKPQENEPRKNPTYVNVRYMVGSSREKRVPIEYVQLAPQYETTRNNNKPSSADSIGPSKTCTYVASSLRDRSMLLGRCKRCGSLRMDCGSCDWATEEEAAVSASHQNAETTASRRSLARTRKKASKRHSALDPLLLEDDSDESSNNSSNEVDEEYDIARLRKLIRRSKQQRRSHSTKKEETSSSNKSRLQLKRYKSTAISKWRRKYPLLIDDLASSSSDSSDSEAEESQGWVKAMERGDSLRRKGRNLSDGKSILESLPTISDADGTNFKQPMRKKPLSVTASKKTSTSKSARQQSSHKSKSSLELSSSSDSDMDDIPLTSVFDSQKHSKESFSKRIRTGDTLTDISLNKTNTSGRKVADVETKEDSYHRQLLELEARARFQMEQQQQQQQQQQLNSRIHPTADGIDADAGFIQPEGEDAVENLPEDMVDLSRNVPYKDLWPLFDSMATKLEDEILPDFKLKMAGLHHKLRILQKQQQVVLDATDAIASTKLLLEEYQKLWEEVRVSMVQNGTDQCRATLRRLMNDRLYKRHRKKLTAEQRKRCRGPGIMDSRNLRMDAMDDAVEAFVRKLKEAVVTCEKVCEENNLADVGSDEEEDKSTSEDAFCDNDVSSGEDDNLDFLPITAMDNNDRRERELAPFRPHEHASRVRKQRTDHATIKSKKSLPSTSRLKSSTNSLLPSRKRPRTTNFSTKKGLRRSTTGTICRSAIQIDTNDAEGEEKLQNIDESTGVMSEEENPSIVPMEVSLETDRAVTSIRHQTLIGVERRRKRNGTQRKPQLGLPEPRNSKHSISERMQAFLDANEANGIQICSEYEGAEAESKARGRQTNNHRACRRKYSILESKSRRKSMQNNKLPGGDHREIEEQGEIEEEQEEIQLTSYDTQSLFDQLSSRTLISREFAEIRDDNEFSDIDKNWECLLSEMEVALSNNPESTNTFLQRSYDVLISRGSRTVQDMIASKEGELSLHIRTLSLCVRSLKFASNDIIPLIFTKDRQDFFFDFLVLQLVDALYSLSLPSAWALGVENCERIFHQLIPLRDALASCIPLVEAVSRCLIRSLECQQWRKSPSKNHVFVSSLDPQCWKNFLETGMKFEDPQVTRFQKLGRVWPRIEVDALWRILAFVGSAHSISTDKSIFRFQVLSKLFSSGVLAVGNADIEDKLPPSEDHLSACQQELRYFSSLLRKGALDSLPKTDSMLVKLIQHSLQLQVDSYEGNGHARASCFPDTRNDTLAKKTASMFWRITHPLHYNSNKGNCRCVSINEFSFDQSYDKNDKTYKMLLYPTSDSLLSCLSLVISWVNRVSLKKIRQNRLSNSLKTLQNDLLKESSKPSEQSGKKVGATFEDAFSVQPPIEVGIGSERATVFRFEAASYLQILASVCMKSNNIDPDLSQSIWESVSNDQMKKKQCNIIELRVNIDTYTGDAYLAFATAKIMATLLFIQMNVSPWHLSLGITVARPFSESLQLKSESFTFPFSCIFACLDCICDLEVGPQVFSHFYEIIILIFRNLSAMIVRGESSLASDHLRSSCISNFIPVLMKCIRIHLVSSRGSHESFHLRLCLSSIRAMHSFVATHNHKIPESAANGTEATGDKSQNVCSDDNGEDMWGDLDDSDLAALDLACISGSRDEAQQQENIWELLSDALEQSKPSKRFAILRSTNGMISGSEFHLSSIGKQFIAEEVDKVCDCFSTAMASIKSEDAVSSKLSNIVSKWSQPSCENDEDSQYISQIERKLTSELCSLAEKYPTCRNFISEHANNMLFNFLKALVDSSRLEKLPSCNLERIGESSGRVGTEQAILMLDLFNDDTFQDINDLHQGRALHKLQNRRRKSVTEIWDFSVKIGTAFAKNETPDTASVAIIGNSLLNLDNDVLEEFNFSNDVISLENETFKTFRLLRNIISCSATNSMSFVAFENVSSCLLLLLANHILSIVQSLKYNDQTSSDKEYKKAKLTELLTSFVELFVSSAAWILQEGAKNRSKAWSFLQSYLRDRLFSPILRNQPIDPTVALQEIIAASRFVHAGPHSEGVSLPTIHCVGLVGCSKYLGDCFFASILRRSKQLIVATAFNPQNLGLQNAIVEAVLGCGDNLEEAGPWIVGSTFPLGKSRSIGSGRIVWPYSSPIQKQIDEYLKFIDQNIESSNLQDCDGWWNSMAITKKSFLKNHVIPRLQSNSLGIRKKRRIIMLLSYILEHEDQSTLNRPSDTTLRERTMDVHLVREIIKALRSNFHKCLMQFSVNDDLARAIVSCSIHLANSRLLLENSEQNLVLWGRTKIVAVKGKTMLDLDNSEVLGSYVWIFFQWLRTFGEIVIDQNRNDENIGDLSSMRKHWKETQCCRFSGMDEERLDLERSHRFETWDRLLVDFEDLALPSKSKKKILVKNIYAKPSIQQQEEETTDEWLLLESWKPSISMKKNLKELMAAIITAS